MRKRFKTQGGFTLFEIIAVLVILGVLSAIIVNRMNNFTAEVYTGANALRIHLRYAQAQAMNKNPNKYENTIMGIKIDPGNKRYWLFKGNDTTKIELLPDDAEYTDADRKIRLDQKNITLTTNITDNTIYFDDRGIPYSKYNSATDNTPLSLPVTIVVGDESGKTTTDVIVTPITGYVP